MVIYKATNLLNQKSYIGKTERTLLIRMQEHIHESTKENITTYFHRALKKYGKDNFEFTVLAETEDSDLLSTLESEFICNLHTLKPTGYNITPGGTGGNTYKYLDPARLKDVVARSALNRKENYKLYPERKVKRSQISTQFWNTIREDGVAFATYKANISAGLKKTWETKIITDTDKTNWSTGQLSRFNKESDCEKARRIKNAKESSGTAKQWKLTYPDKSTKIVKSIFNFCKENDLPYYVIYGCHRSKKPSKTGWNLEELNDN